MAKILLIDDDPILVAEQVRHAFPAPHRVEIAQSGGEGLAQVTADSPDVVLLDMRLPDRTGLEIFDAIHAADARIPVIFVTLTKTADSAIEAMKRGAFDYLFKPLDPAQLRRVVGEALSIAQQMREPTYLSDSVPEEDSGGAIVGACPAMREVYKAVGRVAAQDVPVLITGESGTGKELIARAIYQHGQRSREAFFALNCAAVPENLLESELFGHEKGAFTGADRRRIGRFEQCNGGTLFLDEIGDMSLPLQAKMLRVLQDQTFERVGGDETIRTNVRIISATHRDLKTHSEDGRFRLDLFYRLGVFTIHLPPLRERLDDLPLLVQYFLRRFNRELGREIAEVHPETLERLCRYDWPGNIRELQSVLKQAMLNTAGPVLPPQSLPTLAEGLAVESDSGTEASSRSPLEDFIRRRLDEGSGDIHNEAHQELDRILLPMVMEHTGGNQLQAAKILGIARQTLRRRLRELHIVARFTDAADDEE